MPEFHRKEDSGLDQETARGILSSAVIPAHWELVRQNAMQIASEMTRNHSDMIAKVKNVSLPPSDLLMAGE
jgi:hypothetical protein